MAYYVRTVGFCIWYHLKEVGFPHPVIYCTGALRLASFSLPGSEETTAVLSERRCVPNRKGKEDRLDINIACPKLTDQVSHSKKRPELLTS